MEFYVNGNLWQIVYVRSEHPIFMRKDGTYTIGVCNNNNKTIFLNENLKNGMLKKVLIHEIAHAFMFEYHVDLSVAEEEVICDLIATYGEDIVSVSDDVFGRLQKIRSAF